MEKNSDSDAQLASYITFIWNLKVQMGQISQYLSTHRSKDALPSDTLTNSKDENNMGHAIVVVTRSEQGGDHEDKVQRGLRKMNI